MWAAKDGAPPTGSQHKRGTGGAPPLPSNIGIKRRRRRPSEQCPRCTLFWAHAGHARRGLHPLRYSRLCSLRIPALQAHVPSAAPARREAPSPVRFPVRSVRRAANHQRVEPVGKTSSTSPDAAVTRLARAQPRAEVGLAGFCAQPVTERVLPPPDEQDGASNVPVPGWSGTRAQSSGTVGKLFR